MKPAGFSENITKPILFNKFPDLEAGIPWISLGAFPTPIQQLQRLGAGNLWIKRDDISSALYGGNKIRKLEFILGSIMSKNRPKVISFGGIGTNHGLATAVFCNRLQIPCKLLLFWQPVTEHVQHNLLILSNFDAQLVYKRTLWRTVFAYFFLERIKHPGAYFLYAGGSNTNGTIGYVNAAYELKAQIKSGEMPVPAAIICPLSSGGTLAGLALGIQLAGLNTEVVGIRVAQSYLGPFHACTPRTIAKIMANTYNFLKQTDNSVPDISPKQPRIMHDYFGDGYGYPTAEGNKAYHLAKEYEGILLDPTYTSKTFAAVLDYCRESRKNSGPVLYWNTFNSIDFSRQAASADYRKLPRSLQTFIEQKPIAI
jgi:D-cysteine desulfhydrase